MNMLAFLPWVRAVERIEVEGFRLLPYERGQQPGNGNEKLQATIDAVLAPFVEGNERPIRHATIIVPPGRKLLEHLPEPEEAELFQFIELIAFAALAKRQFFDDGMTYTNRATYAPVLHEFERESRGTSIVTRRRDGGARHIVSEGAYQVRRPLWAVSNARLEPDEKLLHALLKARSDPETSRVSEAILGFNLANTDGLEFREPMEAVLTVGAFEVLLGCRSGKQDELAARFVQLLKPAATLAPAKCGRLASSIDVGKRFLGCDTIREVWIRDFFRMRGDLAHGRARSAYPSVWSLKEHLLYAALIFPSTVKAILAQKGFYELDRGDRADVDITEELLCDDDPFAASPGDADGTQHPWSRARARFLAVDLAGRMLGSWYREPPSS